MAATRSRQTRQRSPDPVTTAGKEWPVDAIPWQALTVSGKEQP